MNKQILTVAAAGLLMGCSAPKETVQKKPNILFIAVDDLRPELGCYGSPIAISPNIDALAQQGLLFNNAHCQQAICSPSRASIMTGARPETINVIENFTDFREENPDIVTLPQHLMANGYQAVCVGKIFHGPYQDMNHSWSRQPEKPEVERPATKGGYALAENQENWQKNRQESIEKYGPDAPKNGLGQGPAYECADVPDATYEDGYATLQAIETMKVMLAENPDQPFFLGLGFKKPHLDFIAPKKYWDLYQRNEIPLATQTEGPEGGAAVGLHPSFELRARYGIPKEGDIPDSLARTLKHGYLACVSYVDAQIGMMMDALKEAGQLDNTIVILWTDHGWHLGDMGIWGKATNYEISTRVPLIVWTPDMNENVRGKSTDALVELVDMYPTILEYCGVEAPAHLEGQSFMPVLENPDRPWKKAVFSQFPSPALREWAANPLSQGMRETYFGPLIEKVEEKIIDQMGGKWDRDLFENRLMGYGMRTENYRFVVWKDYTKPESEPVFIELYDHRNDPEETVNVAGQHPELVEQLLSQFNKGWQGNLADLGD
ncbi:sulfatase [Mangrovibacterium sp.]|uniref:sulfatase n=1 Tax=Mangrovibacterium sp. TaxID=1961364 RepID=UPI00356526AC